MGAVIRAENLVKRYGTLEAVKGIDFEVPEGCCFGFLGPNGAGKSSTIRMISCLSSVTSGRLDVLGEPAHPGNLAIKRQIGVVAQDDYLDHLLTVLENLEIHGMFYGLEAAEARRRAVELLEFLQLSHKMGEQVRHLSGGMRRRLVIARALMGRPRLLILDEPTTGLDPQARLVVWDKLRELKRQGVSIVLTTHYMEEAERLTDAVVIVDHGTILERGTPQDLIARVVGSECWEIPVEDVGSTDRLTRELEEGGLAQVYAEGDRLLIFPVDAEGARDWLARTGLPVEGWRRRPAELQDVFLRLTGRDLRE